MYITLAPSPGSHCKKQKRNKRKWQWINEWYCWSMRRRVYMTFLFSEKWGSHRWEKPNKNKLKAQKYEGKKCYIGKWKTPKIHTKNHYNFHLSLCSRSSIRILCAESKFQVHSNYRSIESIKWRTMENTAKCLFWKISVVVQNNGCVFTVHCIICLSSGSVFFFTVNFSIFNLTFCSDKVFFIGNIFCRYLCFHLVRCNIGKQKEVAAVHVSIHSLKFSNKQKKTRNFWTLCCNGQLFSYR